MIALSAEKVLVCSAWPYASSIPHLGNLIGCLLSGDAFMRYYRLKGADALHVSGSDAHGTNVAFEARQQGRMPEDLYREIHEQIVDLIEKFGIDMFYTTTESPTHYRFAQDLYKRAEANGYITSHDEERAFCTHDELFLADRYIQGTCPKCGSHDAYGNQCDDCGALLEPEELTDPHCRVCGQKTITFKSTRHWYLDLPKLGPQLETFVGGKDFGANVAAFTQNLLKDLQPRAVTRDLEWGIPAPFEGAEGKVLYVWAEAALGYVSATIQYFEEQGDPDGWKPYWLDDHQAGPVKHVYTQGKDNIPFHAVFFPAQLLSSGEHYHLPDQISATEYLNWIGGQQFSKTRRVGLYGHEALELLPSEYWRFYLFSFRPEQRDINFSWSDLDKAINGIFVNNIANLIYRVASLTNSRYDGTLDATEIDPKIQSAIEDTKQKYQDAIESGQLAPAIREVGELAVVGNEFVQSAKPWEDHKPDAMRSAFELVKSLAILLEPFVPSFAERSYRVLGLDHPSLEDVGRAADGPVTLGETERLLEKIDVDELQQRYEEIVKAKRASRA